MGSGLSNINIHVFVWLDCMMGEKEREKGEYKETCGEKNMVIKGMATHHGITDSL